MILVSFVPMFFAMRATLTLWSHIRTVQANMCMGFAACSLSLAAIAFDIACSGPDPAHELNVFTSGCLRLFCAVVVGPTGLLCGIEFFKDAFKVKFN